MQVFDLTRLRDISVDEMPALFEPDFHYTRIGSSHNIAINEETGIAYTIGGGGAGDTCGGGLHMIDIDDPKNPEFVGCAPTGGTHDTQCVIYQGPDEDYQGRELCFNSNGRTLPDPGRHRQGQSGRRRGPVLAEPGVYPSGLAHRRPPLLLPGRRVGRHRRKRRDHPHPDLGTSATSRTPCWSGSSWAQCPRAPTTSTSATT